MIGKVVWQRLVIDFRFEGAGFQQCLDLRCEIEGSIIGVGIVERLNTQAISRDEEFTFALVPNRKGKHTPKMLDTLLTVFLVKMQDCFRVAMSAVHVAKRFEGRSDICVVVNLSVVNYVKRAVLICHWLMTS